MRLTDSQKSMLRCVRDYRVENVYATRPADLSGIVRTRVALVRRGLIERQRDGTWRLTPAGRMALELEGGG